MDYFEAGIFRPGEKEPPVKADAAREIITRMSHANSDADALLPCTLARGKRKHGDDKCELCEYLQNIEEEVKLFTRYIAQDNVRLPSFKSVEWVSMGVTYSNIGAV